MPKPCTEAAALKKSFRDFCVFDAWKLRDDERNSFVGIRLENGSPKIYFPMGYANEASEISDAELRRDFRRLIALLSDAALPGYFEADEKLFLDFPLRAFFRVLEDFLDFGYFVEREVSYRQGASGKIHWAKTVKNVHPQVVEDADGNYQVVYLRPVARKSFYREDFLITLIHKYCVHAAARLVGPLLGVSENDVEAPELSFDYALFEEALSGKIASTFNDRQQELFQNLLTIAKFLAEKKIVGDEASVDLFGVNTFAPVWEMLVDRTFGKLPPKISKESFNPHCRWNLSAKAPGFENQKYAMRPDTILWDGERLFVIDAKFYKFGLSGKEFDLPSSGSICKQIAYAEFVERNAERLNLESPEIGQRIFNAFVLPYCAEPTADFEKKSGLKMRFVGHCYGDWKSCEPDAKDFKPYHRIAGILVDVKSLLRSSAGAEVPRKAFAEMIVEALSSKSFRWNL